jgi:hypothetical protein
MLPLPQLRAGPVQMSAVAGQVREPQVPVVQHSPFWQAPLTQGLPHRPQFAGSVVRSTQSVPHSVVDPPHPVAGWQTPALCAVEPLPVPPTQFLEQHWSFLLQVLPLALQA